MTAASLLLTGSAYAQSAPEKTEELKEQEGKIITLSPFEVDASQDKGYRATSTLAGSRINTDLKNLGAPITVVTSEFLSDVSAVGINDILSYTANTEGLKEFAQTSSGLGRPRDESAESPSTSNRLRGLAKADITRDYFFTISDGIGFDTYNLDQVTISRGPNSVLAGLGSAGGIINYSPQLANFGKNRNEVTYRFGSYDDQRATFNSNIVALKDVLAFRVAGAWSDFGFKQQPAYNRDLRGFAAFAFRPWKKTTIRGSFEKVRVKARTPNTLTPEDEITQWVEVGRPTYDATSSDPVSTSLFRDGSAGLIRYNANGEIEAAYNSNQNYVFGQGNLARVDLFLPIRMSDNRYGNWGELNMNPGITNRRMETVALSVDQEILSGLVANVGYLREEGKNQDITAFRAEYGNYMIDVNKYIPSPTGYVENPHFGETYVQYFGGDNPSYDNNKNEVVRGTLTYQLDLTKTNKWLGHYNLTAFAERRETEFHHSQGDAWRTNSTAYLQPTSVRYYLGGSETKPAQTGPTQVLGLVSEVPHTYFDSASGTFMNDTLTNKYFITQDRKSLTKLDSAAVVAQAYLLDDRVVGTVGIRRDTNKAASLSRIRDDDPFTGIPRLLGNTPYGPLAEFSETTKTYGVVAHPLKWLSVHYNRAQNFVPNAGSVTLDGDATPAPSGLGRDYGFSVNLFDDKLNVKVNWFKLTAASGPSTAANFPLAQWVLPWLESTVMPELAQKAGVQYQRRMASDLVVGDSRLEKAYTSDQVSKGLEVELTYNVTKNWRIMANLSKQEAMETSIAPELTAFIEDRLAYWKATPGLWTGQITTNNPWGLQATGEEWWSIMAQNAYLSYKSNDGKPSAQIKKWHGSALTNYTFSNGKLKGFSVGGGVRYIDKSWLGSPVIKDAAGSVIALDLERSYYYNAFFTFDAWLGYETKIFGDKRISFQINGRDLLEDGSYRPISANSDGQHAVFRIVQPRTFFLTTKLEF